MRNILKLFAFLAVAGSLAACEKDNGPEKGPEGPTDFSGGCEAVDLGVGVKWASYNVGALVEEGAGWKFAWGETIEKSYYGDRTYLDVRYTGEDRLRTLLPEDDAATVCWGSKWRMPTRDDFQNLIDRCIWEWDETRKGYIITGRTGCSIFLPAFGGSRSGSSGNVGASFSGFQSYWSSSVNTGDYKDAYYLYVESGSVSETYKIKSIRRGEGYSVRAVTEY